MNNKIKVLGVAGSLRAVTINLLHAEPNLMPEDANLEIFDIDGIPAFN